jgi:hypothetical protein
MFLVNVRHYRRQCAMSDQSGYEVCAACAALVSERTDSLVVVLALSSIFYVILILHHNVLLCQWAGYSVDGAGGGVLLFLGIVVTDATATG